MNFKYSIIFRQKSDYKWYRYRYTQNSNEQPNTILYILYVDVNDNNSNYEKLNITRNIPAYYETLNIRR